MLLRIGAICFSTSEKMRSDSRDVSTAVFMFWYSPICRRAEIPRASLKSHFFCSKNRLAVV
jgi:hypothetical protein